MLRLAFDFIITWRETRTRPNAYSETIKVVFLQRSHPGVSYFCTVSKTKKKPWNHLKKKQKLCFNNVK